MPNNVRYMLAICGDSGSGKSTLAKVISTYITDSTVVECDRYHKWERGHERWKSVTHLNPDANDIQLMNLDARALKQGALVTREEYDHSTGKFTEPKEIKPSTTNVMCGLHTFYDTEGLYDLKIFTDTDAELKTQWKITRDSNKRGYASSEVIEQIKIRQSDYNRFLKPKIDEADLIVNFCSEVGAVDAAKGIGRSLRLFVKNTYNVDGILEKFEGLVEKVKSTRPGFFQLNVKTYRQLDKNFYYDYVMVCVSDLLIQCVKN